VLVQELVAPAFARAQIIATMRGHGGVFAQHRAGVRRVERGWALVVLQNHPREVMPALLSMSRGANRGLTTADDTTRTTLWTGNAITLDATSRPQSYHVGPGPTGAAAGTASFQYCSGTVVIATDRVCEDS
jgi:hypothetical protein